MQFRQYCHRAEGKKAILKKRSECMGGLIGRKGGRHIFMTSWDAADAVKLAKGKNLQLIK